MMKIFDAEQLAKLDQLTLHSQHISSWELMERAAKNALHASLPFLKSKQQNIHVFCGVGNNGGDGLAIAFHLIKHGYNVKVYKVEFSKSASSDFQQNEKRLAEAEILLHTITIANFNEVIIAENDILIDAIFGVGLNRRMPDFVEALVTQFNKSKAFCISIDLPSGLFLNKAIPHGASFVKADVCLTFQLPKLPLLLPENGKYIQQFQIIPIGLAQEAIKNEETQHYFVDADFAKVLYKPRAKFSHKGTYGHALLVGGQVGMLGSILLASKAAIKSGVGKLSVMLPNSGKTNLHTYLPEAMAINHTENNYISFTELTIYDSVGIGVGIGKSAAVVAALTKFLAEANRPILLDADALNIISEHKNLLKSIPKDSILTPHPGEVKRLIGGWQNDFEKLSKIKSFAQKYNLIVVAKEAYTCICSAKGFYFNSTGNPGMAKAGSGDVLSGIITSLLAQNYTALNAAILGVFLHGLAGDFALKNESEASLTASDIVDSLGTAFSILTDR